MRNALTKGVLMELGSFVRIRDCAVPSGRFVDELFVGKCFEENCRGLGIFLKA